MADTSIGSQASDEFINCECESNLVELNELYYKFVHQCVSFLFTELLIRQQCQSSALHCFGDKEAVKENISS